LEALDKKESAVEAKMDGKKGFGERRRQLLSLKER
jgi:hypothetical protein